MTLLPIALLGCSGPASSTDGPAFDSGHSVPPTDGTFTTDTDPQGACGDVTTWSVTLVGTVIGADANPAIGATVEVEDRGWEPGTILASGTTDAYGAFSLDLAEVTSVEDCWATLLDYVLVGEQPGERGEKDLNSELFNAIDDATFLADLGSFPLRLEATTK